MLEKKYINTSFSSKFEKVNEEFLKCTVSVMSYDQIANGTKFTKESIDRALSTINYAPVIGYFNGDDFEGHGQEIVLSDSGVDFVVKTIPFGVVIKDSYRYEDIPKDNGETEKYLVVDCYLWSRYSDAIDKVKGNECNQSMEIMVNEGSWKENYFEVSDFNFSGICILGEDVQPAFNLAKIRTSDNFSKDDVKGEYSEMMFALDKFLELEEGGEDMEDNKVEDQEVVVETVESEEDFKEEQCEATCPKCEGGLNDEGVCPSCEGSEEVDDEEDMAKRKKCSEEETEEEIEEDFETKYNKVVEELNEVKAKFVDIESQYSELNTEVEELRAFKSEVEKAKFEAEEQERKDAIDSQLEIYADLSQFEGYTDIIAKKYEVEIETTELMLKALAYDNDFKIGKKTKKSFTKETIKVPVIKESYEGVNSKYDNIIKQYL